MKKAASVSPPDRRPIQTLRTKSDYDRVFSTGISRRVGGLVVLETTGMPGVTRVGLVVGKKVGGAVVRNRAKRRLREAMRAVCPKPGKDFVLIATKLVATARFPEIVGWTGQALEER